MAKQLLVLNRLDQEVRPAVSKNGRRFESCWVHQISEYERAGDDAGPSCLANYALAYARATAPELLPRVRCALSFCRFHFLLSRRARFLIV